MAGQTPLLIESDGTNHSVPDHFQDVVVILNTAATPVDGDDTIIFYAERETVVDKVVFWSGTGSDADQTFQLKRMWVFSFGFGPESLIDGLSAGRGWATGL